MDYTLLEKILSNYPSFRLHQTYHALFKKCISTWANSNLPAELKLRLQKEYPLEIKAKTLISIDQNSIKTMIELRDGATIETVLMRYKSGKNVVCVSSQAGCALGCLFCATGQMGLSRNLTASEIIIQILFFARLLKKEQQTITNVVFMGMGEPFLNYEQVMKAIQMINNPNIFNIGARKITISTCGLIPELEKFIKEPLQVKLAFSLHAPNDKLRSELMPINKKYPLLAILKTVAKYIMTTKRKVMIEYILLDQINDSELQAKELAQLLKTNLGQLFMINLIAYNNNGGQYQASSTKQIQKFRSILEQEEIEVTQRFRLGQEVKGGCGQLVSLPIVSE